MELIYAQASVWQMIKVSPVPVCLSHVSFKAQVSMVLMTVTDSIAAAALCSKLLQNPGGFLVMTIKADKKRPLLEEVNMKVLVAQQ